LWARAWLFPDLTAQASAAYSRGDWDRAAALVQQRLKQAPEDAAAVRLAARSAAHRDPDKAAIAVYSQLVVGAMDAEDFYLLGRAWSRTGQVDAAFKAYEMARQGNPDHPATLDALGQLYQKNDRSYAAQEVAERLARQPGWEARGLLMLGTVRAE